MTHFFSAWRAGLGLVLALWALPGHAHKSSDAYLTLTRTASGLALTWDVALRDLDAALLLDANNDRAITWGEVKDRLPEIDQTLRRAIEINQGACPLVTDVHGFNRRVDGAYLSMKFTAACDAGHGLSIAYRLFADIDPTHLGILRVVKDGRSRVLSLRPTGQVLRVELDGPAMSEAAPPEAAAAPVDGASAPRPAQAPVASSAGHDGAGADAPSESPLSGNFLADGISHILHGYDHVLFLLCLLLPLAAPGARPGGSEAGDRSRRSVFYSVLGVVTVFTVAHSLTLALAALRLVSVSPRLVEPAIALTIILTAVDNIWPLVRGRRQPLTFAFGLIHGFGFADVLADLELPRWEFAKALFQFNLGVEIGQLLIVSAGLLILLPWRAAAFYRRWILGGGSVLAGLAATGWLLERVLDIKLMPI